jgi:uncharacterized protein (UPF0303 family)
MVYAWKKFQKSQSIAINIMQNRTAAHFELAFSGVTVSHKGFRLIQRKLKVELQPSQSSITSGCEKPPFLIISPNNTYS